MTKENITRIKPLGVIICDDIRQEDNQKHILIGVYSNDIVVRTLPSNILIGIYIIAETTGVGTVPIEILLEITGSEYKTILKGAVEILKKTNTKQTTGIPVPRLPVSIEKDCELTVKLKQYEDDWKVIRTIPIHREPSQEITADDFTSAASESKPPS